MRKVMLAAQFFEERCRGARIPSLHVFVPVTYSFNGTFEILPLPVEVGGEGLV